jgi:type II secretory pathway component PulM
MEIRMYLMYLFERLRFDRTYRRENSPFILFGFFIFSGIMIVLFWLCRMVVNWARTMDWTGVLEFLNQPSVVYIEIGLLLFITLSYLFFYWSVYSFRFLRFRHAFLEYRPRIRPMLLILALVLSIVIAFSSFIFPAKQPPNSNEQAIAKNMEKSISTKVTNEIIKQTTSNSNTALPTSSSSTNETMIAKPVIVSTVTAVLETLRKSVEAQLGVVLVLIVLGTVFVLLTWITVQDAGVFVLPFTVDGSNDPTLSRSISDLLVAELHRIKRLHEHPALQGDFSRRSGWFSICDLRQRI